MHLVPNGNFKARRRYRKTRAGSILDPLFVMRRDNSRAARLNFAGALGGFQFEVQHPGHRGGRRGAQRLIVLSAGYACALEKPPAGAVTNALHALPLLIARQLMNELLGLDHSIEPFVVPPLCPPTGLL